MPAPKKGETKDEFISRGMESKEMKKEFSNKKQELAVLYSKWENRNNKKDSKSKKNG